MCNVAWLFMHNYGNAVNVGVLGVFCAVIAHERASVSSSARVGDIQLLHGSNYSMRSIFNFQKRAELTSGQSGGRTSKQTRQNETS